MAFTPANEADYPWKRNLVQTKQHKCESTLKVKPVLTLKGHKSKPQAVSETVSNVCAVLALGTSMHYSENIMGTLCEKE